MWILQCHFYILIYSRRREALLVSIDIWKGHQLSDVAVAWCCLRPNQVAAYFEATKSDTWENPAPYEVYLVQCPASSPFYVRFIPGQTICCWPRAMAHTVKQVVTKRYINIGPLTQLLRQLFGSDFTVEVCSASASRVRRIARLKADCPTRISKKNISLWSRKHWLKFSWILEYISHTTVGLTLIRLKLSPCKTIKFSIKRYQAIGSSKKQGTRITLLRKRLREYLTEFWL